MIYKVFIWDTGEFQAFLRLSMNEYPRYTWQLGW
jgi:hypothetical protein